MPCTAAASDLLTAEFIRGDTWIIAVELTEDGEPEALAGAELLLLVKTSTADADVDALVNISYTVPAGPDADAGRARLVVASDQTNIEPGTYWFIVKRIFPGSPPVVWTFVRQDGVQVLDV